MFPRIIMPPALQTIGLFVPHGWALEGYYDVIIREGTQVADLVRPILALCGFGVVFGAIGALRFRFE
jgi:ABC-2 type transport system permease protein